MRVVVRTPFQSPSEFPDMLFQDFSTTDIVDTKITTSSGLWMDGAVSWSNFFTSSRQALVSASIDLPTNGLYYLNVYDGVPSNPSSSVRFSIAYGNFYGSGSSYQNVMISNVSSTKAIYSQYANILLQPLDKKFSFSRTVGEETIAEDSDEIVVVNFQNFAEKDGLTVGGFELTLASGSNSVTLVDDSYLTGISSSNQQYNLVRGTLDSLNPVARYESLGLFYPNTGIVILNPTAIDYFISPSVGMFSIGSSPTIQRVPSVVYDSIRSGASIRPMVVGVDETIFQKQYYIDVDKKTFNYTTNPTFDFEKNRVLEGDPQVYPTTIGLYDSDKNLLAVAKFPEPLRKNFTTRLTATMSLNF